MSNSQLCLGCMFPLSEGAVCPKCGYAPDSDYDDNYRRPGTVLAGRYLIGRVLRKNSEGATYMGYDKNLQQRVKLREYFPYNIAVRDRSSGAVSPMEGMDAQYKALMSDFVDLCNEVKRLGVTEPVIPVEHVFAEGYTVYAVFAALPVMTLERYLVKRGGKLPLDEALNLLLPLCSTVSLLHSHGQIHRGLSPHTVYISERENRLYLGDFTLSATRTAKSELDAELFNGYSAPEQYASNGWQGTWTDVYAVGALLYRMASGFVPPKSTLIGESRPLPPLGELVMDLPVGISRAVTNAMKTAAEDRTQVLDTFLAQLSDHSDSSTAVYDTNKVAEAWEEQEQKKNGRRSKKGGDSGSGRYVLIALLLTVVVLGVCVLVFMASFYRDLIPANGRANSEETSQQDDAGNDEDEDSQDTVPSFVGLFAEAVEREAKYKDRYVFVIKEEYNDSQREGVVYEQYPLEGTVMREKGQVTLYVSKGKEMVTMPDLINKTEAEARAALAALKLQTDPIFITRYNTDAALAGKVISTSITADTEFDPKTTVVYVDVAGEVEIDSSVSQSSPEGQGDPGDNENLLPDGTDIKNFFHE